MTAPAVSPVAPKVQPQPPPSVSRHSDSDNLSPSATGNNNNGNGEKDAVLGAMLLAIVSFLFYWNTNLYRVDLMLSFVLMWK